ncbi:MAG: efflux RND transporter periplasmic adaptor subunit [Candidatus Adiutrix sp.]|jgi:Cu(I)/Ag(I) efflux system membrane fusion protein|nr:efflux RND transporter periplasmic adaptor subunit [Candidatus Adiutrix sp.]
MKKVQIPWLLLGLALGLFLAALPGPKPDHDHQAALPGPAGEGGGERKILYWYDPMSPGAHFEKPGKSPFMDMDLVPRYAEEEGGAGLTIDPVQTQNLALTTARVQRGRLTISRELPANVEYNHYQMAKIQPRAAGFVEEVTPLTEGDQVAEGRTLARITVPAWAADQSEYLLLKSRGAEARLLRGVREKMRLAGMPEEMLEALDRTKEVQTQLVLKAPLTGILVEWNIYRGMNVDQGTTAAVLDGLDPIWVVAEVPESLLPLVEGGRLRVTAPAWPGRVFPAAASTLLAKAGLDTRTVPLRLSVPNPEGLLRPGLTARVSLRAQTEEALLIPTRSLIDLGDEQRVITRTPEGGFLPKPVQVLRSGRDQTAVAGDLAEGEEVVVGGLFLIDSEANLRGALERLRTAPPAAEPAPAAEKAREGGSL